VRLFVFAALSFAVACGSRQGPYAILETSKGRLVARLYGNETPRTVAHLKALIGRPKPFYDGLVFHRVVPGFLIQTGDPAGDGKGNPRLPVPDEVRAGDHFDRPGLFGMASWGPGTSQTQFFITLGPAPDLDGLHTRFGEIVEGLEVAKAIAAVPRETKDGVDRPFDPPVLTSFRIVPSRP
jgi:cyclophilin family peptidyl-prolyl cis-trans isomerase